MSIYHLAKWIFIVNVHKDEKNMCTCALVFQPLSLMIYYFSDSYSFLLYDVFTFFIIKSWNKSYKLNKNNFNNETNNCMYKPIIIEAWTELWLWYYVKCFAQICILFLHDHAVSLISASFLNTKENVGLGRRGRGSL